MSKVIYKMPIKVILGSQCGHTADRKSRQKTPTKNSFGRNGHNEKKIS